MKTTTTTQNKRNHRSNIQTHRNYIVRTHAPIPRSAIRGNDDNDDARAREYDDVRVFRSNKNDFLISPLPWPAFCRCLGCYYFYDYDSNTLSDWRIPVPAIGQPAH